MSSQFKILMVITLLIILIWMRRPIKKGIVFLAPDLGVGTNETSYLGQNDMPRGIRNNNPGNLKMTSPRQGWLGAVSSPNDPPFEQFIFYSYGLRAMLKLVSNKIESGFNTPRKLISNWAPPSDNNPTIIYATKVADELGIDIDDRIASNKNNLFTIVGKIEEFENGFRVMTVDDFEYAWSLI